VYAWTESDFVVLNKAALMVDHTLDPIRVKFMTPEQAEKHMLIVKEK